jgi:hypothetical protein
MDKNTDKNGVVIAQSYVEWFVKNLLSRDVREVYSGKPGCMCGCRGKYSTNPAHKAEADAERGYEQEVGKQSMRMVNNVLHRMQLDVTNVRIQDGSILYFADAPERERNYVVYLCNSATI